MVWLKRMDGWMVLIIFAMNIQLRTQGNVQQKEDDKVSMIDLMREKTLFLSRSFSSFTFKVSN